MLGSSVEPDFEETTKSVRFGSTAFGDCEHGRRLGRIEHLEDRIARPLPEGIREDERREARSPHPEHDNPVGLLRGAPGEAHQVSQGGLHPLHDGEPAERACDRPPVGLARLPERGVLSPDPRDGPISRERFERLAVRAFAAGELESQATPTDFFFSSRAFRSASKESENFLTPSSSSSRKIRSSSMPSRFSPWKTSRALRQVLADPHLRLPVVPVRLERLRGNRIDRVGGHERLDVVEIRVGRVLRGRGSPERTLQGDAPPLQAREPYLPERLFEGGIGDPRVGDPELAAHASG